MDAAYPLHNAVIESVTTGPVPGDPIERDTLLSSYFNGYGVIQRTRRVMRLKRYPEPTNIPDALTPYRGIVEPDPDDIHLIFSQSHGIQACYRRGNYVDEPVLPDNEIPSATFVTFIHFVPTSAPAPTNRPTPRAPSSTPHIQTQIAPINPLQMHLDGQIFGPSQTPPLASREVTLKIIDFMKRKMEEEDEREVAERLRVQSNSPQKNSTESKVNVNANSSFCSTIIWCAVAGAVVGRYWLGMPLSPFAFA